MPARHRFVHAVRSRLTEKYLPLCCVAVQAADDEPVWKQLLRRYVDYDDPEVAEQAAAALAE